VTNRFWDWQGETSTRWGFFAGFRNHNYKTNPPGKKRKESILMKTKIRNSISGLLFIPLLLAGFALLPRAQAEAVTPQLALPGFNTADGFNALDSITTGTFNSGFGAFALEKTTSGSHNTALGGQALRVNTLGSYNTAVGENSLVKNINGNQNMALGQGALANNVTGDNNVAMGFQALNVNNGDYNTAVGFQALRANTTGITNVAIGPGALFANTDGGANTAIGANFVLFSNVHGSNNTATGEFALANNVNASFNTAYGRATLFNNVGGGLNTAIGANAGFNITGSGNVCIGTNIFGVAGESDRTRIRNIDTTTVTGAGADFVTVFISGANTGIIGHLSSSQRYKEDVKPMDNASEVLYQLKPVTFHYKKEIDPAQCLDYGLVAEDVAKIDPKLAIPDRDGKIESVRYFAIYNMMLNEFIKEHKKVEELKNDFQATVARQQKEIQALTAQLKEQAAQIQKVSAQLEVNKPAPQTVSNK
jgi:Chaperone of endosialidase